MSSRVSKNTHVSEILVCLRGNNFHRNTDTFVWHFSKFKLFAMSVKVTSKEFVIVLYSYGTAHPDVLWLTQFILYFSGSLAKLHSFLFLIVLQLAYNKRELIESIHEV